MLYEVITIGRSILPQTFDFVGAILTAPDVAPNRVAPHRCDELETVHANEFVMGKAGHVGESLIAIQYRALVVNRDSSERAVMQGLEALRNNFV